MKRNSIKIRTVSTLLGLLMLLSVCTFAVSCGTGGESSQSGSLTDAPDSGADTTQIPDIPDIPGTTPVGEVPEVPVGSNTLTISSAQLMELIETGTIAENGDYAVTDGEGLTFGRAHNEKEYDLKNALIRIGVREGEAGITVTAKTLTLKNALVAVYGGTALSVSSANSNATLQNIHIGGNASEGFSLGGTGSTLSGCTLKPSEGCSITRAVTATGSNVMVENCNFEGSEIGVADESPTGAMIRNNQFTDCTVAVLVATANTAVWNNTVTGGETGISATDDKAEISACMATVYNVSVAKNTVTGAETAILFSQVSNCVAIMNTADTLTVDGCINAYIIDNSVSGTLTLDSNNYIIADSNGYGTLKSKNNDNTNGDNLTNLSERAAVGVNEKLLPHINPEQFADMTGRSQFRTQYGILGLSDYLKAAIATGETDIIVPPGAYINSAMTFTGLSNINFYGYGVYNDTVRSTATAMAFDSCTRIGLYGFFIGNSVNPNLQGTVVSVTGKAGKETISFVADPGYLANYTIASDFPATNGGGGGIYRADSLYPYSEIWYEASSKSYDSATQVNTIKLTSEGIKYGRLPSASTLQNPLAVGSINVGDRVAFRNYKGACGISTSKCSEVKIEDVTIFNSSGFALSDYDSDVAVNLHRYAVTSGPAPVIDQIKDSTLATVNDANRSVTWTDSYGRLRSAFSLNTTCDATHCTNARTGIQAVSCLMERMMDDGGNINAHYGTAVSYDENTNTLTYRYCDVNGYNCLPADFRTGDKVELYTRTGTHIGSATAISATVQTVESSNVLNCRYTVRFSDDIVLPDDPSDVVVQNASACGNGFLWDNVMVRNNNSYGVRIQAMDGEIRNCSFIGLGKGGVNMIPQYEAWPECGYACDVKILNNVFEELSIMAAQWYDWDSPEGGGSFSPICIMAPGGDSANSANCMFKNITISGNRFSSRYTYYDLVINGVSNLKVTGNTFCGRLGMENTDTQGNILLRGGNGILIDGNTFTANADKNVVIRNGTAQNVTGSDVG
ncbi:MAG: right-handed parallel beta-helix repeat-containing protein [Eubacteriales bacterium]